MESSWSHTFTKTSKLQFLICCWAVPTNSLFKTTGLHKNKRQDVSVFFQTPSSVVKTLWQVWHTHKSHDYQLVHIVCLSDLMVVPRRLQWSPPHLAVKPLDLSIQCRGIVSKTAFYESDRWCLKPPPLFSEWRSTFNRLLYTSFKAPVCYIQDPYLIIMFWSWSCLLPWQSLSALPMASAERIDESDMILEKKKKKF